jgi:ABC-type glycerol-3-phosphate transport system substrate-binding protein
MKTGLNWFGTALIAIAGIVNSAVRADDGLRTTDLNVAIFAYLPDASTALERIEEAFEARHKDIDLDLELWNPYDDTREDDGLDQIGDFDIIEIDACRLDSLAAGAFGGLDPLPADWKAKPEDYVAGARALLLTANGQYITPHWVCGNFLVTRASNEAVVQARSFAELLDALDPAKGRPLLAPMWSRTGLGEFYADALIDIHGPETAREHLRALSKDNGQEPSVQLDQAAENAVLKLADELDPAHRQNLSHFTNHSYVLARQFASSPGAVLLGYSERLYHTERELQLAPGKTLPILGRESIVVRQFPFGKTSLGTPTWVDGFVIPKGKLAPKRAAIRAFLEFIQSDEAYLYFAEPAPDLAAANLMPAKASVYSNEAASKKQPLLPAFRDQLDGDFVVASEDIWRGMQVAGGRLRKVLKPE